MEIIEKEENKDNFLNAYYTRYFNEADLFQYCIVLDCYAFIPMLATLRAVSCAVAAL